MIRLGQLLHFHTRVSLVFLFFILTLFGGLTIYTAINVKAKLIREQALNWILINNSQIAELLIVDNRIGLNSILKSKNNEALSLFDNVIIDSKSAGLYSLDNSVHKGKCSLFYFICVEEDLTLGSFNLGSLIIIKSLIDRDLVIILGVI